MLNRDKGKLRYIKYFQCCLSLIFFNIFVMAVTTSAVFCKAGSKYEKKTYFLDEMKGKLKVKIHYREGPNSSSFFDLSGKGLKLTDKLDELNGLWSGSYELEEKSIFWINPALLPNEVYKAVSFGPYGFYLNLNFDDKKNGEIEITQSDLKYGPVNFFVVNNEQINYWTCATNKDWTEIVRGKIYRSKPGSLYTVFQTTVYQDRIPIYAFQGESVLVRTTFINRD